MPGKRLLTLFRLVTWVFIHDFGPQPVWFILTGWNPTSCRINLSITAEEALYYKVYQTKRVSSDTRWENQGLLPLLPNIVRVIFVLGTSVKVLMLQVDRVGSNRVELRSRPHVSGEFGHQKRYFSKTLPRVESFENTIYLCSCGRVKTELLKNAYVMVWYPASDLRWRTERITFVSLLLGLFSSLMAFIELNVALRKIQAECVSRRLNIRLLCLPISTANLKRLDPGGRQTIP